MCSCTNVGELSTIMTLLLTRFWRGRNLPYAGGRGSLFTARRRLAFWRMNPCALAPRVPQRPFGPRVSHRPCGRGGSGRRGQQGSQIGFVGVTSGPAAASGTSNVRSMQTLADWWNSTGGVKIGDDTYDIDVVTFDDQKDPKRAIAGMEKMAQEGIHYVVGPNVDDGAAAVRPVAEKSGIIYFPYAFPKELYTKPASNAVLGMVASYQSGPAIYKYLKEKKGVKTVAFVAANEF